MGVTSKAKPATIRVARKELYISDVLDEFKRAVRVRTISNSCLGFSADSTLHP